MRGAWGRIFIEPFEQFKWWLLWKLEPWYEEKASLDLEWRVFAQKHNAAGKRPQCWYSGMELDVLEKVNMYEFPYGPDSKDDPIDPDYLIAAHVKAADQHRSMKRKTAGLDDDAVL